MKVSLKKKIELLSLLNLEFISIDYQKTRAGETIAILGLATPIESVRGSQPIVLDEVSYPLIKKDVTEIKVHENDMDTENLVWDEDTNIGTYRGTDRLLDVSKVHQDVWLRTTTFAVSGQDFRTQRRTEGLRRSILGSAAPAAEANAGSKLEAVNTNK